VLHLRRFSRGACAILFFVAAGRELLAAAPKPAQPQRPSPFFREPGPNEKSIVYADGSEMEVPTETVWRPACGSDTSKITVEDLQHLAQSSREAAALHPWTGPTRGGVASAQTGFDLVFNITSPLPAAALEAVHAVEQYIEGQFSDPVTVVIDFSFRPLGAGILGQTGLNYTSVPYPTARAGLVAGMDADDAIQNFLPTGNTTPVRYNGSSAAVTNEDRVFFTNANYLATIGSISGTAAFISLNSNFPWDFTPQDGIDLGRYCFQSTLAHEVGHALGFTSGADFRTDDVDAMDLFRFQMSDGNGTDYNPDTLGEFGTTARMVDLNSPGFDDVISDIISAEYQMSDGDFYQASHFTERNPGIYEMDPAHSPGETLYPNLYRKGDHDMLDALGWDYPPEHTSCEQAWELTCNGRKSFDDSDVSNPPSPPYTCGNGASHDGTLWYRFTATATSASVSTCGSVAQDSTFAVYTGTCGSLVEIACSEDGGCSRASGLSTLCVSGLTIGDSYYIQMSARTAATRGLYVLEIGCTCTGSCCLPPPASCVSLKEDECAEFTGYWAGPATSCLGDGNGDGSDDACDLGRVDFSQLPTSGAEDIASDMDWTDQTPDIALADDFTSDGRPIRGVRWWGSQLDPTAQPDGWLISFHEPLAVAQPPGTSLAVYFCAADKVTVSPTPIPVCDPPHAVSEYEAPLADCCLLQVHADSRSTFVPAQATGFFEEQCLDYEIGIQAVVGVRFDAAPVTGDCIEILTGHSEDGDFWGWHSTANAQGAHTAFSGAVTTSGGDWLYGPWNPVVPVCPSASLAFELITTTPAGGDHSVLWDNGFPNGRDDLASQYGGEVEDWMTVDDVNFPDGAVLQDLHWINEEQVSFTWSGRVRLEIYADTGSGAPDGSAAGLLVGTWIPDGSGTVTRTSLGAGAFLPRYRYDVTGLSWAIPPGTWWIGIATAGNPPTGRSYWTSSHSDPGTPLFFGQEAYVRAPSAGIPTFQPWSVFLGGRKSDVSFEITAPRYADCNCNGIDDKQDIAACPVDDPSCRDCNANGVPDECEHDCNGNGVPDDCDIAQGTSADCQPNGVPDECDLFFGTSVDANHNGIPDECCEPVLPPQAEPAGTAKNRYVSVQGDNPGRLTALRVRLTSLQHPNPPNPPSHPPRDFSAFEGQYRWVGPPTVYREEQVPTPTFTAARLQCVPYYTDWAAVGLLQVYGPEIMPSSLYDVQAIEADCDVHGAESNYSPALTVVTSRFGDVDVPFSPPSATTQPDGLDITGLVNKFKGVVGAIKKVRAHLQPAVLDPGKGINALDIVTAVDAFLGKAYPYTGIVDCPP
jgi:hypothetical protein